MVAQFVGIDVSKDKLDVDIHPSGQILQVARTETGLAQLAEELRGLTIALIAAEATGGYETLVVYGLTTAGFATVIVNPAQVRQYAKACGKRAKTDALDAQVIARFAATMQPEVRPLPDEALRHLSDLMDRRRQIVSMIAADRQREHVTTDAKLKKSITRRRPCAGADGPVHGGAVGRPLQSRIEDILQGAAVAWQAQARGAGGGGPRAPDHSQCDVA